MSRARDDGGQAVVIAAVTAVMIMITGGLALNVSNVDQVDAGLRSAADTAALAGASQLSTSAASAETYAADYAFDSLDQPRASQTTCPSGAPVPGTTVCYQNSGGPLVYVTTPYTVSPAPANGSTPSSSNEINVEICWNQATIFGGLLNLGALRPCASATADTSGSSSLPCALCVLNSSAADALNMTGGAKVTITGGASVVVDSSNSVAANFNGSANLSVASPGAIDVYGGDACTTGCSTQQYNATVSPSTTYNDTSLSRTDPLASVPAPSVSGSATAVSDTNNAPMTISPGVYSSITVGQSSSDVLTLNPGVYVIEGALSVGASGSLQGSNVMLYFTCSGYSTTATAPCASGGVTGGYFVMNGAALATLTAPISGTYDGLLMFYDRNDLGNYNFTASDCNTPFVSASGSLNATGTIYAADAQICISGAATTNTLFDVGAFEVDGSGVDTANVVASQQYSSATGGTALIG